MRHAERIDENQPQLVDEFRQLGAAVYIIRQPADLIVSCRGQTIVVEVKNPDQAPSDRRLTPAELRFWLSWYREGAYAVVEDPIDCVYLIDALKYENGYEYGRMRMREHFRGYSLQAIAKIAREHGVAWTAAVQWMGGGNA